jgi:predicted N-formylglutamate amidohydrolase
VLVCDHAGRAVPERLKGLGVDETELGRHIGWDIGAGALAERLSALLDAPLLRQAYSRLVIDCNRPLDAPSLIPGVSDGTTIPGNLALAPAERLQRIEEIRAPYHAAIAAVLDARAARPAVLVSVHSFTPRLDGFERPWAVGVLHGGDSPASRRMLDLLKAHAGLVVGDNQPYALGPLDFTVPFHAQRRGLDYLELEIRQDLIADESGQARMAERLAPLIGRAVGG